MEAQSFQAIVCPSKPKEQHQWGTLYGAALGCAIYEAALKHPAPLLVVTEDSLTATQLEYDLRFFAGQSDTALPILQFPDWETLPYDNFSPHQDIISQRLRVLHRLPSMRRGIILVPISTLLQRLSPKAHVGLQSFSMHCGDTLDLDQMRQQLTTAGYQCVSQVWQHGEYAVRGAILDIFPTGSQHPFRIDLFDTDIESIRTFDPETQRSIEKVACIDLLPAHEYPLTDEAISLFRQQWREYFSGDPTQCPIYQDVSQGLSPAGVEYYLPLFFKEVISLFDYLPTETLIIRAGDLNTATTRFWEELKQRYESHNIDIQRPLLPPEHLYLAMNECFERMNQHPQVLAHRDPIEPKQGRFNFASQKPPMIEINARMNNAMAPVQAFIEAHEGRILFCAETAGRREVLLGLLQSIQVHPSPVTDWQAFIASDTPICITVAPLEKGFSLTSPVIDVIAEPQLFAQRVMQRRRRKKMRVQDPDAVIHDLAELSVGAPVVHIDHGIGRYQGLTTLKVADYDAEFLTIAYANNDKLYVPVASLHLISRYAAGDNSNAPIHRLGSPQWQKARKRAAEKAHDAAAELLDIYARRAAREGYAYPEPDVAYQCFADAFPFEETPDQHSAIDRVVRDMISSQPMDRLVCGDVGFGKTEVAMRAAFIAANAGKQVIILVPTTLLAQQHYQTFTDRFADWPIKIEVLSRFRTAKETQAVISGLEQHTVDIVIGTHKLLQSSIKFKSLGLLIIDEEHRFGVRQKEKLKSLRSEVDILTLTATPIPRTLNMAMATLRDLSIIATPPSKRLSVKTFVREKNKPLMREAILRELHRGGQVYFLHNAVDTIEKTARDLESLVPEARIQYAHGQMRERELEQIMSDFYHHRFNILVCTTIIETGIDIPTANTIIIDKADHFGLAQLHQLRGRVGRSHHQAFAYLLINNKKAITKDAEKRLDAIETLEDLGAGFTLATHDLEIRGAGELLGESQSGSFETVGFSLYMEMLERAVKAIKSGKQLDLSQPLNQGAEVDLKIPALIPEDYLPDVQHRLTLYKRIANATDDDALKELQVEMIDRFGILPESVKNLFEITTLKLRATALGIYKIELNKLGGTLHFEKTPKVDPLSLINLIQKEPVYYRLDGSERLKIKRTLETPAERFECLHELFGKLTASEAA